MQAPAAPAPGVKLGSYRLVRLLGEGGMGVVFEAIHEGVGGRAAIKILRAEAASRHDIAARFFNEARAANAVEHPSIIRIFDSGYTPDGTAYLAMEYLSGETLSRRMERAGRLPIAEAVLVARQVASALGAVHDREVVHRDLKPDNLIVVSDPEAPNGERIKVLDFGIARLTEELRTSGVQTMSGMVMGTPVYMAPEQCKGAKTVTTKADVYSLGVTLYQMLAGHPPFVSEGVGELLAMHIKDPPPPLRQSADDVTPELAHLVHSMLAKSPDDRPTMHAVAKALRGLSKTLDPAPQKAALNADAIVTLPPVKSPERTVSNAADTSADPIPAAQPALTDDGSGDAKPASIPPSAPALDSPPPTTAPQTDAQGEPPLTGPETQPLNIVPLQAMAAAARKDLPPNLAQLPTLYPKPAARAADLGPQAGEPQLPPGPRAQTLWSFVGETFGGSESAKRLWLSLVLIALISGSGALVYTWTRAPSTDPARPAAARVAPPQTSKGTGEVPRDESGTPVPLAPEPASPSAPPDPGKPKRPLTDVHYLAAGKHFSSKRYQDAITEAGKCSADFKFSCSWLRAKAACRTGNRALVQEILTAISQSKRSDKDKANLEIRAECEADSLDYAEKLLTEKQFQRAQSIAKQNARIHVFRAQEIFGRASCAMKDRAAASQAHSQLKVASDRSYLDTMLAYCKTHNILLP